MFFFFFMGGGSAAKLTISNELLVPAQDYADLIGALSGDYRLLTLGRELGVAKVEEGSIITYLVDITASSVKGMSEVVETITAFRKLFDAISGALDKARTRQLERLANRVEPGTRSIYLIARLAVKANATVTFEVSHPNGENQKLTVGPSEAISLVPSRGQLPFLPGKHGTSSRTLRPKPISKSYSAKRKLPKPPSKF